MVSSKRLLPWSGEDATAEGAELSRPRKRWRSLVLQVRGRRSGGMEGVFGFRGIIGEEFMSMFLRSFGRMAQRVVSEEVEKAISRQFNQSAAPPRLLVGRNQRPRYQLMFLNGLKPVYTMMKLEAKDGSALKVAIVENLKNDQMKIVRFGHVSSVRAEVVVLHGHFNAKNEECWTPEEFNKHVVWGREKRARLLTGDLTLKLNGGEAFLDNAIFTDNSSFTSTKKFRLGLRLVNAYGERVLEGITEPFRVKERRVEGSEKHYPPFLGDEVWRLEKIGRNGAYHQALSNSGIDTVQKFLQSYMKNEHKLLQTFSKMPQTAWKAIIGHAMTCEVGDAVCSYESKEKDMELFFDAIYQPVAVKFGDCYKPIDQLDQVQKNLVEALKHVAYENIEDLQYNHKMVNNCPVPLHRFYTKTSVLCNVFPNQQILNYGQYNSSLGEFSTSQGFESKERFCSFQGATNASVDKSRFVQGQTFNDGQFSHADTQIHTSSFSVGSLPSTDTAMGSLQPHFQLTNNRESFSNQPDLLCGDQAIIQSQQVVTGFQPSRTNSFDSAENDQLIHSFISQIFSSEGAVTTPLSPRKWVKIKAALKLASVGRLSRVSRRGPHSAQAKPRLVPIV